MVTGRLPHRNSGLSALSHSLWFVLSYLLAAFIDITPKLHLNKPLLTF